MTTREPAVAGLFYPANGADLRTEIDRLLAAAPPHSADATALIVPHAGYIYSGSVAAMAYAPLRDERARIRRVIMLGPAHRVDLEGMAVPSVASFTTPLGVVPIDRSTLELPARFEDVCISDQAHAQEHCLEVQLPFLQSVLDSFEFVPIVVGRCGADRTARVLDSLWRNHETLVIVSSDLSHYLPYDDARKIDARTARKLIDKSATLTGEEACGACAINGLMRAQFSQALAVDVIDVRNSGDTAGDKSRVVGYGAFRLH